MAAEHYYWGIDSTDFDSYSDDLPAGLPDGLPDGMLAMVKRTMLMANRQAPEWRLARERAAAKLEALREARSDRDGAALARRDVRLRIELVVFNDNSYCPSIPKPCSPNIESSPMDPPVWRTVRVSGGATLGMLLDRLVLPAMGWERNHHEAVLADMRDGSVFGQKGDSSHIDGVHMSTHGIFEVVDEREVLVSDLLAATDKSLMLLYDLGNIFTHIITVEEVLPEAESSGGMRLINGAGACPPEDSIGLDGRGCRAYQEFLDLAVREGYAGSAYRRACEDASQALNYENVRGGFDPRRFDLEERREAVRAAIGGSASVSSGSKLFEFDPTGSDFGPGAGRISTPASEGASGSRMTETVRVRKDPKAAGVCAVCGSPHNLKLCSRCARVRYCSRECQVGDWRAGHKEVCKVTAAAEKLKAKKKKKAASAQRRGKAAE